MTVKIEGLDKLTKKLGRIQARQAIAPLVRAVGKHLEGAIKPYPRETFRNRPQPNRSWWYERGYGFKWKGGGGEKTSEQLGQRWSTSQPHPLRAVIGNNASYAEDVQGPNQLSLFREIGWNTTDDVIQGEKDEVERMAKTYVDRMLAE